MFVIVEKNPEGKYMIVAEWQSGAAAEQDLKVWREANPHCKYRIEEGI